LLGVFDAGARSVLKFIETNWNLRSLIERDAGTVDMTQFDLDRRPRHPPWLEQRSDCTQFLTAPSVGTRPYSYVRDVYVLRYALRDPTPLIQRSSQLLRTLGSE